MNLGAPQSSGKDKQPPDYIFIEGANGARIGPVPGLSDEMPFALFWSPRPDWFFVDHHVGSFMQSPEVFQITPTKVVKHDSFILSGQVEARKRFPCLPDLKRPWVSGNILGWSPDGRRLAWYLTTRLDVCMDLKEGGPVPKDKQVSPLVMVSDLKSGKVIEGSVVVLDNNSSEEFSFPNRAAYRDIVKPQ